MFVAKQRHDPARVRRLALLAVLALLTAAVLSGIAWPSPAAGADEGLVVEAPGVPTGEVLVVVRAGDTAWDLLLPYVPDGADPGVFVAQVLVANDARASRLLPGSVLRVPVSG